VAGVGRRTPADLHRWTGVTGLKRTERDWNRVTCTRVRGFECLLRHISPGHGHFSCRAPTLIGLRRELFDHRIDHQSVHQRQMWTGQLPPPRFDADVSTDAGGLGASPDRTSRMA